MGTAVKYHVPVPGTLRSSLSVRVLVCQKLQMSALVVNVVDCRVAHRGAVLMTSTMTC